MPSKVYDIIIIGAGAAGLTAAIYAGRAHKSVLCLEGTTYGGQIIDTQKIENYPAAPHISGPEFATKSYEQAESFGTEFVFEKAAHISKDADIFTITTEEGNNCQGKTIIIATGSVERHLGLENEDRLIGRGVSYCATCDGNFFKDQDVAVNGGGNTAFWDAIYLADLCHTVTIIHRRDKFRADEHLVDLAKKKSNIKFITSTTITKLNSEENKLSSIELSDANGNTSNLKITGLFVAIGRTPSTEPFKDIVDIDKSGYIIASEDCKTSCPGIFVAGDTRTKSLHQLVTATSDGAIAAEAAIDYLNNL